MMHKQVTMRCIKLCRSQSWRRSNQALFLFSLLLVPSFLFSADPRRAAGRTWAQVAARPKSANSGAGAARESAKSDVKDYESGDCSGYSSGDSVHSEISYSALLDDYSGSDGKEEDKSHITAAETENVDRSIPWYQQSDDWLASKRFGGCSFLNIKEAYESAPAKIKGCVAHLKNPKHYGPAGVPGYRTLILYGESGSGKSTLARAIALFAGWDIECTTPADYQIGNRGDAAVNLRNKVNEILARNVPTVLVIDEVNGLLENTESKNYDNDATSKEFWSIMDRIYGQNNFFIIGTTNRLHRFPTQIKTRIKSHICKVTMPKDTESRLRIFKLILKRSKLTLSKDAETRVMELIEKNKKWSGRDYDDFTFDIQQIATDELGIKDFQGEVELKLIDMAAQATQVGEDDLLYYNEDLGDEDRQDLYQAQNMWLQLGMQRFQKHGMMGLRTPGLTSADGNYIVDNLFTENQERLSREHFKAETLRKERR